MIARYSREAMASLWSDGARYGRWLDVELALVEVFEEEGLAPTGTARGIREKVRLEAARIQEIERETRHDVIAFLTVDRVQVEPEDLPALKHAFGINNGLQLVPPSVIAFPQPLWAA